MYFQVKYWSDSCPHGILTQCTAQRYQHPTKVYFQNGIANFMVTIHLTISITCDLMSWISYFSYELLHMKLSILT